jgi:hypothetical protein
MRLESRLATDPELAATLQALRESRGLLRQLPKRRAPRNFTLTYAMVGKKPPLPRSYPMLRFATALATLLFGLSYAANTVTRFAAPAASAPFAYGIGGGGGDGNMDAAQPAATEPPIVAMAPAATEAPATEAAATQPPAIAESAPAMPTEAARTTADPYAAKQPEPVPAPQPFQIPSGWVIAFAVTALLGAGSMFLIQRLAANKWRAK